MGENVLERPSGIRRRADDDGAARQAIIETATHHGIQFDIVEHTHGLVVRSDVLNLVIVVSCWSSGRDHSRQPS